MAHTFYAMMCYKVDELWVDIIPRICVQACCLAYTPSLYVLQEQYGCTGLGWKLKCCNFLSEVFMSGKHLSLNGDIDAAPT